MTEDGAPRQRSALGTQSAALPTVAGETVPERRRGRKRSHPTALPTVPRWFQGGFHAFLKPYLRRHFHCVGVQREGYWPGGEPAGEPTIVYMNHPAWFDPLIAHYLNAQLFAPRQFYAPIAAAALQQYQVFAKLGFYGVDLQSTSGTAAFLHTSSAILGDAQSTLWITPEGRFCDVRDRSQPLMPGLAHLCAKLRGGRVIPMAVEYVFWQERLPLCLVRFGQPILPSKGDLPDKRGWNARLEERLRKTQDELAQGVIARDAAAFRPLLLGRGGAGGLYDFMRRWKCWLTGRPFVPEHGDRF